MKAPFSTQLFSRIPGKSLSGLPNCITDLTPTFAGADPKRKRQMTWLSPNPLNTSCRIKFGLIPKGPST